MFVTYALYSYAHDKLYIGCTQDLISRFHSHNSLAKKGYTVRYRPWMVIHVEFYDTLTEALKSEKQLNQAEEECF
jgi:putative endonuclease